MDLLCQVCDYVLFENAPELNNYLTTLRKKNAKSLYTKYTLKNVHLEELDKILNDYIITHNKKFDFYFINCEFEKEFDTSFTTNIENNYHYNIDTNSIKSYSLYYIDSCESGEYKFGNIKQLIIKTISDSCSMSYYILLINQCKQLN